MSKRDDKNLFGRLEKMFGFNKKNEQIFIPKELAKQIVQDTEPKKRGRKPKVVDTVVTETKTLSTPTEKSNIFDLTDISDIDPKLNLNIKVVKEGEKDFTSRVFNLFDIAKEHGIKQLNTDQLTCAYYKVYSANKKDVIRTRYQIANKLYYLDFSKKRNARKAYVVKVKNTNCTYTMSDY